MQEVRGSNPLRSTMKKKITIGILFGGRSAEHEVSLNSAKNIISALDLEKYSPFLIKIKKDGSWVLLEDENEVCQVALLPSCQGNLLYIDAPKDHSKTSIKLDVVFPVLHGTFGEDGTIQGLLKLAQVPFVGASVLGSAVGMDKVIMKRLLRDAGLASAEFLVAKKSATPSFEIVVSKLGMPCFIKPANLGSSVGVSKVKNESEYRQALDTAFEYDRKAIIEEFIDGREIECSVLGNESPIASLPGEVVTTHSFYSYESKYLDENSVSFDIPAKISDEVLEQIQKLAVQVFTTLECEGLGRVDFFLKEDGSILVNEINTLPGFTSMSMYPKMWEALGVSSSELVDQLVELALERFAQEQELKTAFIQE